MDKNHKVAVVTGASRGIGLEFVMQLLGRGPDWTVFATCRDPDAAETLAAMGERHAGRLHVLPLDVAEEDTVARAASDVADLTDRVHLVLNVAGVLHGAGFGPEKKLAHVKPGALWQVFEVNAFGPLLVAKHFHSLMRHDERSVFASLSARVGSISDNRLGGWYAYRSSKAAQNMITKTLAIELSRIAPEAVVLGLHPGTVDTDLSKPFQRGVPEGRLLPPNESVASMLQVIERVTPESSGRVFDFRGEEIAP